MDFLDNYWDMMVAFKYDINYYKLKKMLLKADHVLCKFVMALSAAIVLYEAILTKRLSLWMGMIFVLQFLLILYMEKIYALKNMGIDNLLVRFEKIYDRIESEWESLKKDKTDAEINEIVKQYQEEWCKAESEVRFGKESPITASNLEVSGQNTNQYFQELDPEYYYRRQKRV